MRPYVRFSCAPEIVTEGCLGCRSQAEKKQKIRLKFHEDFRAARSGLAALGSFAVRNVNP